jgi:hypothetical protein
MPGNCFIPCRFSKVSVNPVKLPCSRNARSPSSARAASRRSALGSIRLNLGRDLVALVVFGDEPVDLGITHRADRFNQIADTKTVDRIPELHLGLDLVALSNGHFTHVVAEAGDLASLGVGPGRRRTGPDRQVGHDLRILPVAHHDFPLRRIRVPMNPNSRPPWADWFRFMKSMSIDDQGMSRLNCV